MHAPNTTNVSQLISVSFSEVQELSSIGDKTQRILEVAIRLEMFTPKDLVDAGVCKDSKEAWWWINRLAKKYGIFRKVRHRFYYVVREIALKLLQKPVKRISEGIKRRKALKTDRGSRKTMGTRSCVSAVAGFCVSCGCGVGGVVGYGGLWVDNGRYYVSGVFKPIRQGRGRLWSLGVFSEAERVVYFEATHVVTNLVLDGVVVVYTNVEDFGRFGAVATRVEWRPPSGFVKRRGVAATLRKSLEEYVKAFKALWVVLVNNLSRERVAELLRWQLATLKRCGLAGVVAGACQL
jgi:hypothetical protein